MRILPVRCRLARTVRGENVEPRFGPSSYSALGITDVSIPPTSILGPVAFRFPKPVFVTGFAFHARDPEQTRFLQLRIEDETFTQILVHYGLGAVAEGGQPVQNAVGVQALSGLVTMGPGFSDLVRIRPFVLQRPVAALDHWYISVVNGDDNPAIPELHFMFDQGLRR